MAAAAEERLKIEEELYQSRLRSSGNRAEQKYSYRIITKIQCKFRLEINKRKIG